MLLQRIQFVIPLRDVLGAIVIDELLDPHLLQHRRAFFGAALGRIKGHNAPRREVGLGEEIGGGCLQR